MLTNEEIVELFKKQEENYYNKLKSAAENDFKRVDELSRNCCNAMINNEIYLVQNDEFNKANILDKHSLENRFNEVLQEFINDEDFHNMNFKLKDISYNLDKSEGFKVFYSTNERKDISRIKVEVIASLSDYILKVLDIKQNDNNNVFYRGHGSWKYKLVPGIYRNNNSHILENESNYIKEIISSYPRYFKECKTALDFLSVFQHNGFPTRLLDFSENPLIALYMACDNKNNSAADVIRISVPKEYFKYYDSDTVSILSNIAFAEDDFLVNKNHDNIELFNEDISIKKLVHLIRNEKPFFKSEINPKHLDDTILFVKPKQDFERISKQSGLFALFGINGKKNDMPKIEYMNPPCNIKHFIIPREFKKRIIGELSRININEANVYCDMEHVAKFYSGKLINNKITNHIENTEIERLKNMNKCEDILKNL